MIIAMIFGAIVATMTNAQMSFEDCKKRNFEPKACSVSKVIYESSK